MKEKKTRILIVEDETIIAEDLKTFLEDNDFEVIGVVNTGQEALDIHQQMKPDLVVMDIVLDDEMNGIEAANKMQEIRSTPIIFLTALKNEVVVNNLRNIAFYKHIMKPFRDSDLIKSIESMISSEQSEKHDLDLNQKMQLVLDNISEGIVIMAKNGKITFTNKTLDRLCGTSYNRLLSESLFQFDNSNKERTFQIEVADKTVPIKVRALDLNWDDEFYKMFLLHDLTNEQNLKKDLEALEKQLGQLQRRFEVGSFQIEYSEDPRVIDANPTFIKKMKFKQFSDIHASNFLDLLDGNKRFQMLFSELGSNTLVNDFEITFKDLEGERINGLLHAKLTENDQTKQITGQVFFQD